MTDDRSPEEVFRTMLYPQAVLVKSLLESSGLECMLFDDTSNSLGYYGVEMRIMVPHSQAEQARAIIAQAENLGESKE